MADIFISYSRKDSDQALSLAERLRASGMTVWIDQHGIEADTSWSKEIVTAIKSCNAFCLLLSDASIASMNVVNETSLASEFKRVIVPIELHKVQLTDDLHYQLAGLQRTSINNIDAILHALEKYRSSGTDFSPSNDQATPERTEVRSTALRIAVLPFEDQSPQHDNEWFSDGLTDELISTLGKLDQLFVVDSQSSRMYKGAKLSTKDIASQLHVGYIVRGAVRKAGDKIRIQATLIEAASGTTLWDEKFNGTMDDIFEIQEKTALDIADGLKLKLTKEEVEEIEERGTDNVEAYELYLRAITRGANNKEGHLAKIELIRKAIALDPNYSAAYGALAVEYANYIRSTKKIDKEILVLLEEATEKVSQLAPGTQFEYAALSNLYSIRGEAEKAIETAKKIVEVAPKKAIGYGVVGFMYMKSGQWKEAAKWTEQALTINPNNLNDYNNLHVCYQFIGDRSALVRTVNRSSTYYEQFLALHPDDQNWRSMYMFMLDAIDRQSDSKREAERLLLMPDIHVRINTMIAAVLARQGDVERAVESLRADARKGFFDLDDMRTDTHFWQNIQALPNFEELLVELEAIAKGSNG